MASPSLRLAAEAVRQAEALLICTGAGMGVDSGLGTFRGRNAGVWPPLKAMQLDFSEMSNPRWFDHDPRLAWAFWHFRHQAYTRGQPHAGYELLSKWGTNCKHGFFSVTSNIDGHWARTPGVGPDQFYECHGAVTHMQCVDDDGRIWPTDPEQIAALVVPSWDLSPGEVVEAQKGEGGAWHPAKVAEDGCSIVGPKGEPMQAKGVRRPGGPDLLRVPEGCALPVCPITGKPARPNVLMFGDYGVNVQRIDQQAEAFQAWRNGLPKDVRLVVIEVGAGKAVSTIRRISEGITHSFPLATLVRINLDDFDVPRALADQSLPVGGLGALEAISAIDGILQEEAPPGGA